MAKKAKVKIAAKKGKATRPDKSIVRAKKTTKSSSKTKAVTKAPKRTSQVRSKPKPAPSIKERIESLEKQISQEKKELTALRKKLPPQEVSDYTFKAHDGSEIKLSEMFGAHNDLILVHNMGKACPYCTLWADGFVGFTKHLENRAGFVVVSKDDVDTQREFYQSRNWNFRMYSCHDTTFNKDSKFESEKGGQWPGVSAFHKDETGKIYRTGYTYFGPGDDFCAVWPMLDLLKDGPNEWEPKFAY
jgi:predicted dithiol-disulfide oxidoreductase (DUF899 family)